MRVINKMARPKKNNADYFPHDSGMRNDRRIKALRAKFGHVGYSVYVMLIESLTDADFFELEFDAVGIELLAGDFDVESKILCEIIDYCKLLGLIMGGYNDEKIWSDRHKRNFEGLISKRKRDRSGVIADGNTVIADGNPQSKVKKNKVKKRREDSNGDENKPASPLKPKKETYGEMNNVSLFEEELEKLKNKFTDYEERINNLSLYISSKGDKYKSHYATILSWDRKDKKENNAIMQPRNKKEVHDETRERFARELLEAGDTGYKPDYRRNEELEHKI